MKTWIVTITILVLILALTLSYTYTFSFENFKAFNENAIYAFGSSIPFTPEKKIDTKVLDSFFNTLAKNSNGKIINSSLPLLKNIPVGVSVNVKFIDPTEVSLILSSYLMMLNSLSQFPKKSFTTVGQGVVTLDISSNGVSVTKIFTIPVFIYNSDFNIVRRLIIKASWVQYRDRYGIIKIIDTNIPRNIDPNVPPLLPPVMTAPYVGKDFGTNGFASISNVENPQPLVSQKDIAAEKARQALVKKLRNSYACYGVPAGQTITDSAACLKFGGVWDREVQKDSECPFYKANKNYTNTRGGNINGYCEMPTGIQIKGFRYYSHNPAVSDPVCYNCKSGFIGKGTEGHCCDAQKNLKSPDYAFSGDGIDRFNSSSELAKQSLSVK